MQERQPANYVVSRAQFFIKELFTTHTKNNVAKFLDFKLKSSERNIN